MGESSYTILELHLGDGDIEIGPFELFGASDSSAAVDESELTASTETETATDEADAESGCGVSAKSVVGLLLALAALVAIVVGVAKLRGDEEEVPPGIAGDE
jgi:hypothetical protein